MRLSKLAAAAVMLLSACLARAEVVPLGHNLASTSYTLAKGQVTVGTQAVGVGLTPTLTVATSPFLYLGYNMHNLVLKQGVSLGNGWDGALQVGHYKSGEFGRSMYIMETTSLSAVASKHFNSVYTLHTTLNYMYFFDETVPFSLRREPHINEAAQTSLSTLHEFRVSDGFAVSNELGILGLNYKYPQFHFGTAFQVKWPQWLLQIGFSTTIGQAYYLYYWTPRRGRRPDTATYDWSMHPEVQVQYFF